LLVFVHGGFCDSSDWENQIRALGSRFRVLSPDLRGHGASTVDDPQTCTVENFAADVAAMATAAGARRAVFIGHSLGCRVVLELTRNRSDLVAGLVLVDGSRLGSPAPGTAARTIAATAQSRGVRAVAAELFGAMFFDERHTWLRERVVARALAMDEDVMRATMVGGVRWDRDTLELALATIRVPTLAIQATTTDLDGTKRTLRPGELAGAWLELLRARTADVAVDVVDGAGHFCMLEEPERVTAPMARFAGALRTA
jgi:pimeloyl-ACP methyl ester carboxylesterase